MLVRTTGQIGATTRAAADRWKLSVPRSRLDVRKSTFAAKIPEKLNSLPAEIKDSAIIVIFKNALKRYHIGT